MKVYEKINKSASMAKKRSEGTCVQTIWNFCFWALPTVLRHAAWPLQDSIQCHVIKFQEKITI